MTRAKIMTGMVLLTGIALIVVGNVSLGIAVMVSASFVYYVESRADDQS